MTRTSRTTALLIALLSLASSGVARAEGPHWSYAGEHGPDHWAAVDPADNAACASGKEQSPIAISAGDPLFPEALQVDYKPSPETIVNNGHTIQDNYAPGSSVTVDGQSYALAQFHFHAPSEHVIDGKPAAMELHLVHKNAAGGLAVVGVMIEEGAENSALAAVIDHMPKTAGEPEAVANTTVDAAALLPADRSYWRYAGSLTTPPCSEGVKWHVMKTAIQASAAQIAAFKALFPEGNSRPLQAMNARSFLTTAPAAMPAALPKTGSGGWLRPSGALLALGLALLAGLRLARRKPGTQLA